MSSQVLNPLGEKAKVTCFSTSSAALLLGGSGVKVVLMPRHIKVLHSKYFLPRHKYDLYALFFGRCYEEIFFTHAIEMHELL